MKVFTTQRTTRVPTGSSNASRLFEIMVRITIEDESVQGSSGALGAIYY
jgi:hypothetical protein